jgi:hypothetical protein
MASRRRPGDQPRPSLERLRAVRSDPAAARAVAREILATTREPDALLAAVETLAAAPADADRPALRACYDTLSADPLRRDPGGTLRAQVLACLAAIPSRADLDLAEAAATTVERTLHGTGELLRAAGLNLLALLEPDLAAARAAVALGSGDWDLMSGEPALTAARVLAALGHTEALLLVAISRDPSLPQEVRAAAIGGLAAIPPAVFPQLAQSVLALAGDLPVLALADLLLAGEPSPERVAILKELLATAESIELYASLVTAIVASRRSWALSALLESLPLEADPARRAAARDALQNAPPGEEVARALRALARRSRP